MYGHQESEKETIGKPFHWLKATVSSDSWKISQIWRDGEMERFWGRPCPHTSALVFRSMVPLLLVLVCSRIFLDQSVSGLRGRSVFMLLLIGKRKIGNLSIKSTAAAAVGPTFCTRAPACCG